VYIQYRRKSEQMGNGHFMSKLSGWLHLVSVIGAFILLVLQSCANKVTSAQVFACFIFILWPNSLASGKYKQEIKLNSVL